MPRSSPPQGCQPDRHVAESSSTSHLADRPEETEGYGAFSANPVSIASRELLIRDTTFFFCRLAQITGGTRIAFQHLRDQRIFDPGVGEIADEIDEVVPRVVGARQPGDEGDHRSDFRPAL